MRKRFIIVPITALATLGLSTNVILANTKVSVINDNVYIEENAELDVDWDVLKRVSINQGTNNITMHTNSAMDSTYGKPLTIGWTIKRNIEVPKYTMLTEDMLGLDGNQHIAEGVYLGTYDDIGVFERMFLGVTDDKEYGYIYVTITVVENTVEPTLEPTLESTSEPTVTTPSAITTPPSVVLSPEEEATLNMMLAGSKTIEIPYGSELTIASLGLDTSGRFEYEYEDGIFFEVYNELDTFETVVEVKDTQTNTTCNIRFTLYIVDKTKPELNGVKKTIKIIGGKNVIARIKKGVSATDDVDGKIAKSKIEISGYKIKKYDKLQKVTFTVKDSSGNITMKTVKLKIVNPVKKVKKTMYTKTAVNVRKTSSAKGKKIGRLKFGTKVQVVARDRNTGWYKIKYKGGYGWVSDSHLSKKKLKTEVKSSNDSYDSSYDPNGNCICDDDGNCICNCICAVCYDPNVCTDDGADFSKDCGW